jgi:dihydroorotate dehydrogenase
MVYRTLLKLLTNENDGSIHRFAPTLIFIFCQLIRLNPFKRSQAISPVKVMGLTFSNPVGLAAGFDRTGKFLPYSEFIGFGSTELGTLNIDATKALDKNTVTTLQNLSRATANKSESKHPQQWGINLGSLRNTLDEQTVADYTRGMNLFWQYADYLVINLSRPESDARALKLDMYGLDQFLTNIKFEHQALCTEKRKYIPVLAKLAIDYHHNESMAHLLLLLKNRSYDGVILAFENWPNVQQISDYLTDLKTKIDDVPFIVVGGIRSTEDAQQLIYSGASLVQTYTSLVKQGPLQTRQMITKLVNDV